MVKEFQLSSTARSFFETLNRNSTTGKITNQMERFMLCCNIGLIYDEPVEPEKGPQMVDYFPGRTEPHQHLFRAFAFYRYAIRNQYQKGDPNILMGMKEFFDDQVRGKLNDSGFEEFSRYAAGGFEIIRTKIGQTNDLATFLIKYVELLNYQDDQSEDDTT